MRAAVALAVATLALGAFAPGAGAQPAPSVPVPFYVERAVPTTRDLHAVDFADSQHGWVGAEGGLVYRTTDGGRSWSARPTGLSQDITILSFVDAQTGWAGTPDLGIARTNDGGNTWQVLHSGEIFGFFNDMRFLPSGHGYAVGKAAINRGYLIHSPDGGATWDGLSLRYQFEDNVFYRVDMTPDAQHIWVLSWLFTQGYGVSVSHDGGETWGFVGLPAEFPNDMEFASADVGVVVGELGEVFRTTDGGSTWLPAANPVRTGLNDVSFVDDQIGWAVGQAGTVLRTIDGGLTWTPEVSGTASDLTGGAFTASGHGWTAGPGGEVRHRLPNPTAADVVGSVVTPPQGQPRPPIVVAGDDDFDSPLSGVTSGSGTAADPYIIEGHDIVPVAGDGITLAGTTAHVIIRNNRIHDSVVDGSGIRLVDTSNVTIESNIISRTTSGIVTSGGTNLSVRDNEVSEVARQGIEVAAVSGAVVDANHVSVVGSNGIQILGSTDVLIERNRVVAARLAALRMVAQTGRRIVDAVVRNNELSEGQDGMIVQSADETVVEGNVISLAERYGIQTALTNGLRIENNHVFGSSEAEVNVGVQSADTVVTNNVLGGGLHGIRLQDDVRTLVSSNTITGTQVDATGLIALGSDFLVVEDNSITGPYRGLLLERGSDGVIRRNVIRPRGYGIEIEEGSTDALVEENTIRPTAEEEASGGSLTHGVRVDGDSLRPTIRNNQVLTTWTGVEIGRGSLNALVEDNTIRATLFDGVRLTQNASGAIVRGNVIETAGRDGVGVWRGSNNVLVERNTVQQVDGAGLSVISSNDVIFRDNYVASASVGFESRTGVEGDSSRNLVEHNTFAGLTTAGVSFGRDFDMGHNRGLVVRSNIFNGSGVAFDLSWARGFTATDNNITGFALGLDATDSSVVDVRNVWWGAADGPGGPLGPGSGAGLKADALTTVLFDPWLSAPSSTAGVRPA